MTQSVFSKTTLIFLASLCACNFAGANPDATDADAGTDSADADNDDGTSAPNYCDPSWLGEAIRATPADYRDVVADASPGDIIAFADGSYAGFALTASGTAELPIVVRAETPGGATIDLGAANVRLAGDYGVLACFDLVGDSGGQVSAVADHTRITRNVLSDPGSRGNASIIFVNARFVRVDHNDIGGSLPLRRTGIRLKWGPDQFARVDHNYIHDSPNEGGGDATEYEGIWISTDPIFDSTIAQRNIIERNLFQNWRGDNEVISAKSSGNTIANNTLVDSGEFSIRSGQDNVVKNNVIDNAGIVTYGERHLVIGNRLINSAEIEARPGRISSDHPASIGVTIVGNDGGTVVVGGRLVNTNWDNPASGCRLDANSSDLELIFEEDTALDFSYTGEVGEASGVSREQVGPTAP